MLPDRDVRDLERTHGIALLIGLVGGAFLALCAVVAVTILIFSLERIP